MKKFEFYTQYPFSHLASSSEEIIKLRYNLTLPTQKLLLFLISHLTYERKNEEISLHEINLKLSDLYELIKEEENENLESLKKKLELSLREIQYNNLIFSFMNSKKELKYETYSWSSFMLVDEKTNEFIFKFNDFKIPPLLIKIKEDIKLYLDEYFHLKSSHAINLYWLLKNNNFDQDKNTYEVEELKNQLQIGADSSYKAWFTFKKFILH